MLHALSPRIIISWRNKIYVNWEWMDKQNYFPIVVLTIPSNPKKAFLRRVNKVQRQVKQNFFPCFL